MDAAFLRDAAIDLQHGVEQVQLLRREPVPEALKPVKAYLLASLERSLERERARNAYYKSGELAPMERILCSARKCGAADQELLRQLRTESDPGRRYQLSWHDWNNRVVQCDASQKYRIAAWQRFLKQYGITERRIRQPVEYEGKK